MRKFPLLLSTVLLLCSTMLHYGCSAQNQSDGNTRYQKREASYAGTGKYYLGREIAHVMGFQGIGWLERDEREKEENTSLLLKNMQISAGEVIADIGAGSGYHVFKIAKSYPKVEIYAVDIQKEMLQAIEEKKQKLNVNHVHTVQGSEKQVNLPVNKIDKVLMVDVYHEFSYPYEMMQSIKSSLKPNGKVYLIEYRKEDESVPIKELHKMSEKQAVKEMKAAGFILLENINNLPWQHCMVFTLDE